MGLLILRYWCSLYAEVLLMLGGISQVPRWLLPVQLLIMHVAYFYYTCTFFTLCRAAHFE